MRFSCLAISLCSALAAQDLRPQPSLRPLPTLTETGFVNDHRVAADRHEDRVVVCFDFAYDAADLDAVLESLDLRRLPQGPGAWFEVLEVPRGTVDAWVNWLGKQPGIAYAEPDHIAHTTANPNDPLFSPYQWNFFDQGQLSNGVVSNYGVNGVTAWNTSTGAGVVVAVVDTGIAYENYGAFAQAPDLGGATFVSPYNFVANTTHANDDNGHGTHVAGTIRQSTNNSVGVAGLAYNCTLMPVKVLNSAGSGSLTAIANGIRWAADHGAKVISMSLGGSSGSTTLSSAVTYAWGKGCVLCAATGNTGRSGVSYPARYTECIAVGATRFDGQRVRYSTYGTGIDVVAPGGDTSVDQNGDGYADGILQQTFATGTPTTFGYYFFQGTSMATPHVAAIAAMVAANKPAYTNAQIRSAIETSCRDLGAAGYDTKYGNGLVNAAAALTR